MGIIDDENEEGEDFWREGEEKDFEDDVDEPESFDLRVPIKYGKRKIDKEDN